MADQVDHSLPLEIASGEFAPSPDNRPRMPEPPPVRLVAVEDVRIDAPAGLHEPLDDFYVTMLKFNREYADRDVIVYGAENFRLLVKLAEMPAPREDLRPVLIEVPDLLYVEHQLADRKMEYERLRRLELAQASLLLLDPGRNWVELMEYRPLAG